VLNVLVNISLCVVVYTQKTSPLLLSNNSVKNRPIFVIIGIHIYEYICNHILVMFLLYLIQHESCVL